MTYVGTTQAITVSADKITPKATTVNVTFGADDFVYLPPIVDLVSHGSGNGVFGMKSGYETAHAIVVNALGAGAVAVYSGGDLIATVAAAGTKTFTPQGNEAGNFWEVS
jgi:hypothetical protein